MPDRIPEKIVLQRYNEFAHGRCECCEKNITMYKRGSHHGKGSWEAHHAFPDRPPTVLNIRIMCSHGRNCHFNCGHNGNWHNKGIWPRYCRQLCKSCPYFIDGKCTYQKSH